MAKQDTPNQLILGYDVKYKAGSGSYSDVYVVNSDGKSFAIKVLNDYARRCFIKYGIENVLEIDIMSRLRHPHLLYSNKIICDNETNYGIQMPVAQLALIDLKFDLVRSINTFHAITSAIAFLHNHNILHLDIHVSNILFVDGIPMLSDFGTSRHVKDITVGFTSTVGNYYPRYYRPFENLCGNNIYNHKSDVWALGMTILTNIVNDTYTPADDDESYRDWLEVNFTPYNIKRRISTHLLDVSKEQEEYIDLIADLVVKMLELDPDKRITIDQVLQHKVFYLNDKRRPIIDGYEITPPLTSQGSNRIQPYNQEKSRTEDKTTIDCIITIARQICKIEDCSLDINKVIFLAVDIGYRTIHCFPLTYTPHIIACALLAVMYIHHRYLYKNKYTINHMICKLAEDGILCVDDILVAQIRIIEILDGIIYRAPLYKSNLTTQQLDILISKLNKVEEYPL